MGGLISQLWLCRVLVSLASSSAFVLLPKIRFTTIHVSRVQRHGAPENRDSNVGSSSLPRARVGGSISESEILDAVQALQCAGFDASVDIESAADDALCYHLDKATGMLKLQSTPTAMSDTTMNIPRWIPIISNMENMLVKNGWSFLDPDESEPIYAFDVDAANLQGSYQPKWGTTNDANAIKPSSEQRNGYVLSELGFDIRPLTSEQVLQLADKLENDQTRLVLLEGGTDPPNQKVTHNRISFNGPVKDVSPGLFVCAVGGLPLFSTHDLCPTTASSGWLSFSRPLSEDHIIRVQPAPDATDQRVEVVCARSRCHLGHFFGVQEGYCINASSLNYISNFISKDPNQKGQHANLVDTLPVSWHSIEQHQSTQCATPIDPSLALLQGMVHRLATTETVLLGAGCFWHVDHALRRLPGVVSTEVGYAGGSTLASSPTYEDVCQGQTGHAEVVRVEFVPAILPPEFLFDCFLSMHDPTKFRAHGKHAQRTGQYRSCLFVANTEMEQSAHEAIQRCQVQLQKDLSTELRILDPYRAYYTAEDRHQRHYERRKRKQSKIDADDDEDLSTLMPLEWLRTYGKRSHTLCG